MNCDAKQSVYYCVQYTLFWLIFKTTSVLNYINVLRLSREENTILIRVTWDALELPMYIISYTKRGHSAVRQVKWRRINNCFYIGVRILVEYYLLAPGTEFTGRRGGITSCYIFYCTRIRCSLFVHFFFYFFTRTRRDLSLFIPVPPTNVADRFCWQRQQ